jgi:acyl-CoA reductase-like NAD-dependent aldehyde dehydrogenase
MTDRLPIRKTYKLFVGGSFVRSESGRYDSNQGFNIPRGSRKDVRDAVAAGRKASGPWAARTAYNRGQILYRFAEALESRAADFHVDRSELDASIDTLVHYAGWTDKLQPVMGGINPVAAPYLSFSLPEPTGVVGVVAPDSPALLGLVAELAPVLAGHHALNAIVDVSQDAPLGAVIDRLASESVTRVRHSGPATSYEEAVRDPLSRLEAVTELKTAWHPVGA